MQKISISPELASKVPNLCLSCIECSVVPESKNEDLWQLIDEKIKSLNASLKLEEISQLPAIAISRKAYKACGKDPARYRLSAEALLRRVVNRGELYQVNNVVDALNLISIGSGFSIGGYDVDKIDGEMVFGIGRTGEPYEGIGRGEMNIEFMPVFRDNKGAFGTPTSDSVRTSVTPETIRFLMVIIDFGGTDSLMEATQNAQQVLERYTCAGNFEIETIKA